MYADKVKLYYALIGMDSSMERKGKTTPYTSINGHMFSFLDKDGKMGLRLSKDDLQDFIEEYSTKLMVQHGRIMKEYAEVPDELLTNTNLLTRYVSKSLGYVSGLKSKPSKSSK